MNMQIQPTTNGLNDPKVRETLVRLHRAARGDAFIFLRALPDAIAAKVRGKSLFDGFKPHMKNAFIQISHGAGEAIYNTARAINAKRIVEFGTSFGVSTIYLAAAVRANGGGKVIGTELEPTKVKAARQNITAAGLESFVDVREGDATKTLLDVEAPIDLVLLDGWKDLYIPLLKMLTPKLRKGSVVFADNIHTFRKTLRPYVTHMRDPHNGFVTTTLATGSGLEYSVFVGATTTES
jgi:predicted O-methyltransferase YrrM